jgi:hypothetical protein
VKTTIQKDRYDMALPHRWLHLCLVFLLAAGCVNADTKTFDGGIANWTTNSAGVSVSYFGSAGAFGWWATERNGSITGSGVPWGTVGGGIVYEPGNVTKLYFVHQFPGSPPVNTEIATWTFSATGTLTMVGVVTATQRVCVRIPGNDTDYSVTMRIIQDGTVLTTFVIAPGASPSLQSMTVPAGSTVTAEYLVSGLLYQDGTTTLTDFTPRPGGVWKEDSSAVTRLLPYPAVSITPTSVEDGGPDPSPTIAPKPVGLPTSTASSSAAPTAGNKPIWSASGGSVNTENADLLTNSTYREGVNKIFEQAQGIREQEVSRQKTQDDAGQKVVDDTTQATSDAVTDKATAAADLVSKMPSPSERNASGFTISSSAPTWTIAMMGHSIDCDPFRSDRFGPVCSWFKTAMAWFVMGWFAVWLVGETKSLIQAMAAAQQAKGAMVEVLGNGTTAPLALIVAGAVTVAFGVAITAVVVYFSKDLGAGSVLTWCTGNPYSGAPGGVAYVLDQVFPLGVIAACLVGRVVFSIGLQTIFGVFATSVRFCLS